MTKIEERAYDYAIEEARVEGFDFGSVKDGYIKGATDQKAIDDEEYRKDMRYLATKREELIDKACEAYCKSQCRRITSDCRLCPQYKAFRNYLLNNE